jgi:hypothetical protein
LKQPSLFGELDLGEQSYVNKLLAVILIISFIRILALGASELNFHGDEAQYWS